MLVFRQLVKESGWRGLWLGLVPTLYRDVPFSGIYWTSYELLRKSLDSSSLWSSFVAGAIAGSMAALLTAPFDVAKTRRQMYLKKDDLDQALVKSNRERSLWRVMRVIYQHEGWSGLMAGVGARVAKVAPSCAIMISTYELGKFYFNKDLR